MNFKIYDLDDCTFLVDTDSGVVSFDYECKLTFTESEVEVDNLHINYLMDETLLNQQELNILLDEVRDRKYELEEMIIEYWIKERSKESDD